MSVNEHASVSTGFYVYIHVFAYEFVRFFVYDLFPHMTSLVLVLFVDVHVYMHMCMYI